MKIVAKIFTLLFTISANIFFSQAPQSIPYQAVVRNTDGTVMSNTPLSMTFKIHDVSATGTVVYEENHTTSSNAQGLVVLNVGGGTPITGTFNSINWGNGAKFLHVLMNAGNGAIDLGTQQMMSVPYALYANDITLRVSLTGDSLFIGDQVSIVPGVSEANEPPLFTNGSGAVDAQGNSYNTIIIGEQEWFSGYLKSDYFANGERIDMHDLAQCFTPDALTPMIADYWLEDGSRALPDSIYGHFYNPVSITENKNVCPVGWRTPNSSDIFTLFKSINPDFDSTTAEFALNAEQKNLFWNLLGWKITPINNVGLNSVGLGYPNSFDFSNVVNQTSYNWTQWLLKDSIIIEFYDLNQNNFTYYNLNNFSSSEIINVNRYAYFPTKCIKDVNMEKSGCTNSNACNFHAWATIDDGSCVFTGDNCDDHNTNTANDIINPNCNCEGETAPLNGVLNCNINDVVINGCDGDSTLVYFEKEYPIFEIDGQCWFGEDLQTSFSNDSLSINIISEYECFDVTKPAMAGPRLSDSTQCCFSIIINEQRRYNPYAYNKIAVINDNICPKGWHVSTECDWKLLLGGLGATIDELNSDEIGCYNNVNGDLRSFNSHIPSALGIDDNTVKKEKSPFNALANRANIGADGFDSNWWIGNDKSLVSHASKRYLVIEDTYTYFIPIRCVKGAIAAGCMDVSACNYNYNVSLDDGSCLHVGDACNDSTLQTMNDVINDACECVGQLIIENPVNLGGGVTDIDGNLYSTVVIGNQEWMSENLKTTRFRNGDQIERFTDVSSCWWWEINYNQHLPIYLINNNDMINNSIYGKMYNFYAANDPRGVCPTGWRLPNDSDIYELVDYITPLSPIITDVYGQRYSSLAGGKLKAINGWSSPNEGATNEFGFSALGGGEIYIPNSTLQFTLGSNSSWWLENPEYNGVLDINMSYRDRNFYLVNSWNSLNLNSNWNSSLGIPGSNAHYIRCIKD